MLFFIWFYLFFLRQIYKHSLAVFCYLLCQYPQNLFVPLYHYISVL
nr:MAG TPA: hypothetical protein [Caudoviricetes sp.]